MLEPKKADENADKEKFSKNWGNIKKYAGTKHVAIITKEAGSILLVLLSKK